MRNSYKILSTIMLIAVLFTVTDCTIQKRKYLPGLTVQWHKKGSADHPNIVNKKELKAQEIQGESQSLTKNDEVQVYEDGFTNRRSEDVAISSKDELNFVSKENELHLETDKKKISGNNVSKLSSSNNTLTKSKKSYNGNVLMYALAVLMSIASFFTIKKRKKFFRKTTKWANVNPIKTQFLIAGIELALLGLGVFSGFNLHKMGVEISDTPMYIFGGLSIAGFLSVPFFKKKKQFVLPKTVNRHRLSFLTVLVSSFIISNGIGNNLATKFPDSSVTQIVQNADQSIFGSANDSTDFSKRTAASVGMIILAVLGFIVLVVTLCAGICLLFAGEITAILGGLALIALSIAGMVGIIKSLLKYNDKSQNHFEYNDESQ